MEKNLHCLFGLQCPYAKSALTMPKYIRYDHALNYLVVCKEVSMHQPRVKHCSLCLDSRVCVLLFSSDGFPQVLDQYQGFVIQAKYQYLRFEKYFSDPDLGYLINQDFIRKISI